MADRAEVKFVKLAEPSSGSAILLTDQHRKLGSVSAAMAKKADDAFDRASKAAKFEGKAMKSLQLLAPAGLPVDRLTFVGLGDLRKMNDGEWLKLGGVIAGAAHGDGDVTVVLEKPSGRAISADDAANVALGIVLRSYSFDRYKTKKKDGEEGGAKARKFVLAVPDPRAATQAWKTASGVADGVMFARDLVNEPANTLGPVEFADRLKELSKLGVDVKVMGEPDLRKLKMGALLGVAQGSERPPRVVVMSWWGGAKDDAPIAFVGKGVVFDTGGISIKPAAGMEDMKGDMGGAAAVAGVMHALAARKAKTNAVGIVGLVENMPDGKAQRPGDIVTSMSGQTIEVINTDAEGRLVLGDLLTYIERTEKPVAMINLATLTGAIIVALGHHNAGMFSNNDQLSDALTKAGLATGEHVWRMPLGPEYDKQIDSKFADMKNVGGGRWGGAITAAQFLQRFVENDTPWAHLDVAGTAMSSPSTDINRSWASGWGVRLLDQLVRAKYEGK